MELIAAIALMCQVDLKIINTDKNLDITNIIKQNYSQIQECQTKLAKCMTPLGFRGEAHLLKCIGKR